MFEGVGKYNSQIDIPSCFMHCISRFCSCFFEESDIRFYDLVSLKMEFGCIVHHVLNHPRQRKNNEKRFCWISSCGFSKSTKTMRCWIDLTSSGTVFARPWTVCMRRRNMRKNWRRSMCQRPRTSTSRCTSTSSKTTSAGTFS